MVDVKHFHPGFHELAYSIRIFVPDARILKFFLKVNQIFYTVLRN